MDYSPNAASLFRDLGGLDDMIFRLKAEIGISNDPSSSQEAAQAMQISNDSPEATSSTAADATAVTAADAPAGGPADDTQDAPQAMQIAGESPEATTSSAAGTSAASAGPPGDPQEASQVMQAASSNPVAAASHGAAASAAAPASAAASAEAGSSSEPPPVPYHRRVLLKSLLRAIALASYAPGTATRPDVGPCNPSRVGIAACHCKLWW